MKPAVRNALAATLLVVMLVVMVRVFPSALAFTELAARELRYFWWLVLMVALAVWLIWGFGRGKKP